MNPAPSFWCGVVSLQGGGRTHDIPTRLVCPSRSWELGGGEMIGSETLVSKRTATPVRCGRFQASRDAVRRGQPAGMGRINSLHGASCQGWTSRRVRRSSRSASSEPRSDPRTPEGTGPGDGQARSQRTKGRVDALCSLWCSLALKSTQGHHRFPCTEKRGRLHATSFSRPAEGCVIFGRAWEHAFGWCLASKWGFVSTAEESWTAIFV